MYEEKKFKAAKINYLKAINLDSNNILAYYNLGNTLIELKEYDDEKALGIVQRIININDKGYKAYKILGDIYSNIGNYSEADKNYKFSININPYEYIFYNNLANSFNELGLLSEAIQTYKMGIRFNPSLYNVKAHTRIVTSQGIPDIIITVENEYESILIIVENKLKADEGYEQTKRYADD